MAVINYPSQAGIITFNLTASSEFMNPLYAGDQSSDGAVPINLAVYLGSYAGMMYKRYIKPHSYSLSLF